MYMQAHVSEGVSLSWLPSLGWLGEELVLAGGRTEEGAASRQVYRSGHGLPK